MTIVWYYHDPYAWVWLTNHEGNIQCNSQHSMVKTDTNSSYIILYYIIHQKAMYKVYIPNTMSPNNENEHNIQKLQNVSVEVMW